MKPEFTPMDRARITHAIRTEIDRILDVEPTAAGIPVGIIDTAVNNIANSWIRDVNNNVNDEIRQQQAWNVAGDRGDKW